jgi:hypothetical protein
MKSMQTKNDRIDLPFSDSDWDDIRENQAKADLLKIRNHAPATPDNFQLLPKHEQELFLKFEFLYMTNGKITADEGKAFLACSWFKDLKIVFIG